MKGKLLLGLPFEGQRYYDVQVRLLTIKGECEAIEALIPLQLNPESTKQIDKSLVEMAYLAQQIEVEGIPTTALTPHYLLENLLVDDYNIIMQLIDDLRKKLMPAGENPKQ